MHLTKDNIYKIARLARLKIDDQEADALCADLEHILGWVEKLKELNTEAVEPMVGVTVEAMPMRDDKVTDGGIAEEIMQNAPDQQHGMFAVPKVIE